ncbi:hypothetical protein ACLOJK_000499 [Asimina triloba]
MAGWGRETNAVDARISVRDLLPNPLLITTRDNLPSSSTVIVRIRFLTFSTVFYFRPDLPSSSLFIIRLRSHSLPSVFSIPDRISPSSSPILASHHPPQFPLSPCRLLQSRLPS